MVVGLGGGSLPMFIRAVLPGAVVEAVELDPAVADIARESFGVVDGDGACFVMFGGRGRGKLC